MRTLKVQKPPSQLCLSLLSIIITITSNEPWNRGRFPFSQNFRNFWFGGKWNTFRRLVPLENSQKKWKSKKVGQFSRLEFPNGMSCSINVSRSLYQFQVHRRAPRRTGVYGRMEQLFTNRKFHFCSHRNFWVFFLNGKRPPTTSFLDFSRRDRLSCAAGFGLYSETRECLCFSRCLATLGLPRMPEVFNFSSFLIVCGDATTETVRTGYFILGFSRTDPWIQGTLGFAL